MDEGFVVKVREDSLLDIWRQTLDQGRRHGSRMLPMVKGLLRLRGMILPLLWLLLQLLLLPSRRTAMSVWMWVAELTPMLLLLLLLLLLQMAHLRLMLMLTMAVVVRLTCVMLRVAVRMIVVDES